MSSFIGNAVTPPSAPILDGGFAGLASFLIRMITILAGLFSIWNFIVAGFFFMSAGNDPEALSKAWGSIWKSLIGLLLIVKFCYCCFYRLDFSWQSNCDHRSRFYA